MKQYIFTVATVIMTACGTATSDNNRNDIQSNKIDTSAGLSTIVSTNKSEMEDSTDYDNATFFVVVADTSTDYYFLHKKMFDLNGQFNIPIDTMGRFYNKTKNLIALPDDDKDELYAGDYFPRRFPSENLSLEYLNFYHKKAGDNTIALITGIYESEKNADSALTLLHKTEKKVFKIKADIYLGCMH